MIFTWKFFAIFKLGSVNFTISILIAYFVKEECIMARNMDNHSKKSNSLNFQSYVDSVKAGSITWDFFFQLINDLCITNKRQKSLNTILLQEFKNNLQNTSSLRKESRINTYEMKKVDIEINVFCHKLINNIFLK